MNKLNLKIKIVYLSLLLALLSSISSASGFTLKVSVDNLRNSKGVVQFALYNKDGTIPDENYQKQYKKHIENISKNRAETLFTDLPEGRYAINILHDENKNGEIDKGLLLPTEGIGFSNYDSISITNKPNFKKASFKLNLDTKKSIKVIYL
ncbi:hypothetical protein MNB_SV-6-848 [hydrothermal vent metagenome]|uniref:DUF2141 domain-containing protein n=1 Tax=hydrothermal vent metagenome TaxID=652676 RepID=A0A1W1BIT7_9ZZZZ